MGSQLISNRQLVVSPFYLALIRVKFTPRLVSFRSSFEHLR